MLGATRDNAQEGERWKAPKARRLLARLVEQVAIADLPALWQARFPEPGPSAAAAWWTNDTSA
ncbi:hypothetical protein [Kitasatospora cineracea]|nr:hypothetical protein [Kitasatospora cineracea]